MSIEKKANRSPWSWIPTLYFAEGIPYIIVMFVASDMFKTMGVPNAKLAFWTSMLYLPWVIKPLWSPFIDQYSTKRNWIVWMQIILGVAFIGISLVLQLPWWFQLSMVFLYLMAFTSSTHDIAADGFYMLALNDHEQAFFTGIRSVFYRLAMIFGLGALVMITGVILDNTGLETVELQVKAVNQTEITEIATSENIEIIQEDGEPRIVVYPTDVKIPLYNETDENPSDSTNIFFTLSAKPIDDKAITMTFGLKKGSADIFLVRGDVIKFNKDNWNIPQMATFKVDKNLHEIAQARFDAKAGNVPFSWSMSLGFVGLMFILFSIYHKFLLPHPEDGQTLEKEQDKDSYFEIFASFFRKKGIVPSVAFLLLYRFSESQLTKMASPFLLDARENGGLALSLTEKGFAYGTVGLLALVFGGLLGAYLGSKHGLKKWIWWMAIGINIPNIVYIIMSYNMPDSRLVINSFIAIEQFGYGFGFAGYMLYMLYVAGQGKHKTAHFAITTAFMALGMMIPSAISGFVQEALGYQHFFLYVIACTIPSFLALFFIKIDPVFGKKTKEEVE
ncbi:MAG: MFS transporter [Candidatus Marinimicrobia bacterium]|nr:MFS transporter [Candidatus Neomarinimicrobiota bacterium]